VNRAPRPVLLAAAFAVSLAALAAAATAEDGVKGGPPPNNPERVANREEMWRAPTAEDWKKPVLIPFQRTFEDAVAVSKETGRPILVCINMDGEIASEHYAGVRYRQPEIAELYKPYVTVVASVYRHTPRDHDEEGRRILCPRFGSVTCGEHIALETVVYDKFLDGVRIAPRHIMLDLEGKEVFDVYYANDTASVFQMIREGVAKVPPPKPPIVRGDRPVVERVESPHLEDRVAVEKAYQEGDAALRKALLEAAARQTTASQVDLLRLAILGLDPDLARTARMALAKESGPGVTELISEAIQVPLSAVEREALIGALKRLGESSTLARWLAGVHQGLTAGSSAVDASAWKEAGGGTYGSAEGAGTEAELAESLESGARAARELPQDPEVRLQLAEATLALAIETPRLYETNPRRGEFVQRHLFADAKSIAEQARDLGASGWRLCTMLALTAYYTGNAEEAFASAAEAVKGLPPGEPSWNAMAVVKVFAEGRYRAIRAAVKEKRDWPPEWLSDVHAAYEILRQHPLGTDQEVLWHYDFLVWLGAEQRAAAVLRAGLERFDASPTLHALLRKRVLERGGPEGLERIYARRLETSPGGVASPWFAGLASLAAAEQWRKDQRFDLAWEAYGRAIERIRQAQGALEAPSAGLAATLALAHAGRARLAYQKDDDEAALEDVLASFEISPDSAGTKDDLGMTPGETGQILLTRLRERGKVEAATRLDAALSALDPELLVPDR